MFLILLLLVPPTLSTSVNIQLYPHVAITTGIVSPDITVDIVCQITANACAECCQLVQSRVLHYKNYIITANSDLDSLLGSDIIITPIYGSFPMIMIVMIVVSIMVLILLISGFFYCRYQYILSARETVTRSSESPNLPDLPEILNPANIVYIPPERETPPLFNGTVDPAGTSSESDSTSCSSNSSETKPVCFCLEPLDVKVAQVAILHCGHKFHFSCVNRWFRTAHGFNCPNCRVVPKLPIKVTGVNMVTGNIETYYYPTYYR